MNPSVDPSAAEREPDHVTPADVHYENTESLDRIAGMVPQRATNPKNGNPMWMHSCGYARWGEVDLKVLWCERCDIITGNGWQALYTLGGAA